MHEPAAIAVDYRRQLARYCTVLKLFTLELFPALVKVLQFRFQRLQLPLLAADQRGILLVVVDSADIQMQFFNFCFQLFDFSR